MFKKTPVLMAIVLATTATCATPTEPILYDHATLLPIDHLKFLLDRNLVGCDELITLFCDGKPQASTDELAALVTELNKRYVTKEKEAIDWIKAHYKNIRHQSLINACIGGTMISSLILALAIACCVVAYRNAQRPIPVAST